MGGINMYINYTTSLTTNNIAKEMTQGDWKNNKNISFRKNLIINPDIENKVDHFFVEVSHKTYDEYICCILQVSFEDNEIHWDSHSKRKMFKHMAEKLLTFHMVNFAKSLYENNTKEHEGLSGINELLEFFPQYEIEFFTGNPEELEGY